MNSSKLILALGLGSAVALFSGCGAIVGPYSGTIYTDVKSPITATPAGGSSKEGESVCTNILGIVALGDCSVDTAAKNGNIKTIKSVDTKVWSILGIYTKATTVVKGD